MATKRARTEAARVMRRLLEAVDRGELDAPAGRGSRLLRRMEGAVAAWESEAEPPIRDNADRDADA